MPTPISWKLNSGFGYSMQTFLDRFFLVVTIFDFEKEFHCHPVWPQTDILLPQPPKC